MEVIAVIVGLIFGWAILKMVLVRIYPKWGHERAEEKYRRDPNDVNERLMWEARSRMLAKAEKDKR